MGLCWGTTRSKRVWTILTILCSWDLISLRISSGTEVSSISTLETHQPASPTPTTIILSGLLIGLVWIPSWKLLLWAINSLLGLRTWQPMCGFDLKTKPMPTIFKRTTSICYPVRKLVLICLSMLIMLRWHVTRMKFWRQQRKKRVVKEDSQRNYRQNDR